MKPEFRMTKSETKLESRKIAALSLTPARSRPAVLAHRRGRWERGNLSQSHRKTARCVCRTFSEPNQTTRLLSPLPQGEGQGEGERHEFKTNLQFSTQS
jgi:hypothetical protein